jgi:hypothetical protein
MQHLMHNNRYTMNEYRDVTMVFCSLVNELPVGVLLPSNVNLYDAMTAVEVLDARMDAGCPPMPTRSIQSEAMITKATSEMPSTVGLVDSLLAMFSLWIERGYALHQSVYTCRLFHRISPSIQQIGGQIDTHIAHLFNEIVHATVQFVNSPDPAIEEDVQTDTISLSSPLLDNIKQCPDDLKTRLNLLKTVLVLLHQLQKNQSTENTIKTLKPLIKDAINTLSTKDTSEYFDPDINRKYYSPAPPKQPIVKWDTLAGYQMLENWVEQLEDIRQFKSHDLFKLIAFLQRKSRSRLDPVLRNALTRHFVHEDKLYGKIELKNSIKSSVHPYTPKLKQAQFYKEASLTLIDLIYSYRYNPSRTRRLLSKIIGYFESLQASSQEWDSSLGLASWTYSVKLECIKEWFLLGFDNELWSVWELGGVYWYFEQILLTHLSHLSRSSSGSSSFGDELVVLACLARSNYLVATLLEKQGRIKCPDSDMEVYWENRWRLLRRLGSPVSYSFAEFRKSQPSELLPAAELALKRAKTLLEGGDRDLLKVVISNLISLNSIEKTKVEWRYSKWFFNLSK